MFKKTTLPGFNPITPPLQESSLLVWLSILLGLTLSLVMAALIAGQEWLFLAALVVPPVFILAVKVLLDQPFTVILIWLLFYPIFFKISGAIGTNADRSLHYILIPASFAILIMAMFLKQYRKRALKVSAPDIAMLLFLALGVINVVALTPNPERTLVKFYFQICIPFAFYWFIRFVKPKTREYRHLVWIAVPILLVQVTIGLLSWFAPSAVPEWWLNRVGARTTGTVGNPAVFTFILILCAALLFHYAVHTRSQRVKIILFTLVGLAFFCVFFSFSRSSWLAGLIVWAGLLWLHPRLTWRLTFLVMVLFVLLGPVIFSRQLAWAQERLTTEETVNGRVLGANATWGLIKAKPLFGWGYDTHDLYDEQFRTRVLDLAVNKAHSSHQTYLLITSEMGVVGLLLFLFPVGYWVVQTVKHWYRLPRSRFRNQRLVGLLWLVMAYYFVVSNFTEMIHSNYLGTTIWWLVLGLIANEVQPFVVAPSHPFPPEQAKLKHTPHQVNTLDQPTS